MGWEDWIIVGVIVGVGVFMFGVVGLISRGAIEYESIGRIAEIEQLRADVVHIKPGENEDVWGQVVEANREIRAKHEYRKFFWGRLWTPGRWERVEMIECEKEGGVGVHLHNSD